MRPENTTENHTPETRPPWRFDRGRARASRRHRSPPVSRSTVPPDSSPVYPPATIERGDLAAPCNRSGKCQRQPSANLSGKDSGDRAPRLSAVRRGNRPPVYPATVRQSPPSPETRRNRPPLRFSAPDGFAPVTPCRALARPFNTPCNRS